MKCKRMLAILLTAGMIFSAGASEPIAAKTTQPAKALDANRFNAPGTFPILKEKTTMKIAIPQNSNVKDYATNAYTLELEKRSNIKLEFEVFPSSDAKQKFSLMVSANQKLPDIVAIGMSQPDLFTYGTAGVFLKLNDYYEKSSHYIKQYMEKGDNEKYLKYIKSADGNIYSVPKIQEQLGNQWSYRMWINETWLNKLNLKMPKTTDDYFNVLKAFKEKDPNDNGKNDELPLISSANRSPVSFLMNAFIYSNSDNDYLLDNNGTLEAAFVKPEWKQGVEYIAKLVKNGLLDPATFTQNDNQLRQIMENPEAQVIGSYSSISILYTADSERKKDIKPLFPLTGPQGANYATKTNSDLPVFYFSITKDCKDPEAAFKLADLMWSLDMSMWSRYGVPDVDWKKPAAGVKGLYTDSLGFPATVETIKYIWGSVQNSHWNDSNVARRVNEDNGMVWSGNPYDEPYLISLALPGYVNKAPKNIVRGIILNNNETMDINETANAIRSYVRETTTAFILENRSLDTWSSYINELEKMGLKRFLSVYQKAYDRTK